MHVFELLKDDAAAVGRSIVVVHGDDAYLRARALTALTVALVEGGDEELAVSRFAGEKASLADVLDELRTLPFLVKRRVVIVDEADPFVTAHRRELETLAEKPATAGALVLSVKSWPANTKLAKLVVSKAGLVVEAKTPDSRELPAWLVTLARTTEGVKLHPEAAGLLVDLVGPEVGLLVMELAKLSVYVGDRREIGRDDVARMVGAGRVEKVYKVVDDATTGKGARALAELGRLIESGEHPVGLLARMGFPLRNIHHAGQLRIARRDLDSACREAGIYPSAKLLVQEQHKHLGPTRVAAIPGWLVQADLDLKGNSVLAPDTLMERLLVRLSRKRID